MDRTGYNVKTTPFLRSQSLQNSRINHACRPVKPFAIAEHAYGHIQGILSLSPILTGRFCHHTVYGTLTPRKELRCIALRQFQQLRRGSSPHLSVGLMHQNCSLPQNLVMVGIEETQRQVKKLNVGHIFQHPLVSLPANQTVTDPVPDFVEEPEKIHVHVSPGRALPDCRQHLPHHFLKGHP